MELIEDMQPGHLVTVYRDPATETRREGLARLISPVSTRRGLQRWNVRFHPSFEEPIRKRTIAVLEADQKVGHGIARSLPHERNPHHIQKIMHQKLSPKKKQGRSQKTENGPAESSTATTNPTSPARQSRKLDFSGAIHVLDETLGKTKKSSTKAKPTAPAPAGGFQMMARSIIGPSPWNRDEFSQTKLDELIASIKERGIQQPIHVRPNPKYKLEADGSDFAVSTEVEGARVRTGLSRTQASDLLYDLNKPEYEIIAGERRWLAAGALKLSEVPVIVREAGDLATIEDQAEENLRREDLNPIHEAEKYSQLIENYKRLENLTADQAMARVEEKLNVSKSTIYDRLRLLKLPEAARSAAVSGRLPASHAVLIAKIDDAGAQEEVTKRILNPNRNELPDEDDEPTTVPATLVGKNTVMGYRDAKRLVDRKLEHLKNRREYETLRAEFEKAGRRVLDATESKKHISDWGQTKTNTYVGINETVGSGIWDGWKKHLGKLAPPEILAQHPKDYSPIRLYFRNEAEASLKQKTPGKKKTSSRPDSEVKREREHKARVKLFLPLLETVATSAESNDSPEIWEYIAAHAIERGGSDCVWRVTKRRFPEAKKDEAYKVLREWASKASGKQLRGLAAEIFFASFAPSNYSSGWGKSFPETCKLFGVKPPPWEIQTSGNTEEVKI